jgi:hypothetical protein
MIASALSKGFSRRIGFGDPVGGHPSTKSSGPAALGVLFFNSLPEQVQVVLKNNPPPLRGGGFC